MNPPGRAKNETGRAKNETEMRKKNRAEILAGGRFLIGFAYI